MKLEYKKVILTGFAFFIILAFWQAYDNVVPLLLVNKFNLNQTWSGVVMALDNVFAVFMLPIFGALSDKTNSRYGRRTPFIVIGTVFSVIIFMFLPIVNSLWLFIIVLLLALISMSVFRSPAVALMPDVTCKPHRSKANAVINLMGTAGGIIVLGLGIVFKTSEKGKIDFLWFIFAVCVVMLLGLIVFILTVKENKWATEMQINTEKFFPDLEVEERNQSNDKLSRGQLKSLIFILASVVLWYMGYNAVTSKFSLYATNVLNQDYNSTMLIAQGAAIISYIPVGIIASRVGRKNSIIAGVAMLFVAFFFAIFVKENTSPLVMYGLFALAGIGWATINVNSYPMVVELAKNSDTGKYTGYYYTASMSAQILTPVLSGAIMDLVGTMNPLFVYSAVCVALALITTLFIRHGDSKPQAPKNKLEMLAGADD
ncbi:MAG: MFS transporter [Clostridia bacterium]|nr:MFS transporter [Clostridia bacterium]